jgi:hypothetical protein
LGLTVSTIPSAAAAAEELKSGTALIGGRQLSEGYRRSLLSDSEVWIIEELGCGGSKVRKSF